MRPAFSRTCGTASPHIRSLVILASIYALACLGAVSPVSAADLCERDGGYDRSEISSSVFFTAREQTKFAPHERSYPLASRATARYCFSRGCTGQLTVSWTEAEQNQLRQLREEVVTQESAQAELHFIKIATLQMETWLFARLRSLDQGTVNRIMQKISKHYGQLQSDDTSWVTKALSTYDRFDKECATYAMEATQHLLVLANLGLLKHWNVTAPVYRYGIPGHWTAGLENRNTCRRYRFDLNSRASVRHNLHVNGRDPARLEPGAERLSSLYPGMDGAGMGRSTTPGRPNRPAGGFALNGPRSGSLSTTRAR